MLEDDLFWLIVLFLFSWCVVLICYRERLFDFFGLFMDKECIGFGM